MKPFNFGLLADCQYADKDTTHVEGRTQNLRQAASCLAAAVAEFSGCASELSFVLTLGDIIDGNATPQQTAADFERIAAVFDQLCRGPEELPVHHVIGNHCLTVERGMLLHRLRQPACYRRIQVSVGWRLLVLDTTEMSGHSGHGYDSALGREAAEYLVAHPLSDEEPHMHCWNGGISRAQLRWLEGELSAAAAVSDRCLVAAHHQVGAGSARLTHMAWNWRAVQAVLLASPAFMVFFAGHDHKGGYCCIDGRHFVTLEAMLEAPLGGNAYAFVACQNGQLHIHGRGSVTSRTLRLHDVPQA